MQPEQIVSVLLSAAGFLKKPIQDVAGQSLKDGYEALKGYLKRKFGSNTEAADALDKATEKPESAGRKAVLLEEVTPANLSDDAELVELVEKLSGLLMKAGGTVQQYVVVQGDGNRVQVAGRDIIHTKKHVQRNEITPDERHITSEQKDKILAVNKEIAERLAGENGKPDYSAGHRMLQNHFGVTSYLLLPREKFAEAMSFLKQQRAINRSKLRRHNPVAYQNDFYRGIWARSHELGWDKPQVYQFALEKLSLKKPITSLKQLGSIQLKSLAEFMQREVRKS
jgi:hypothetical protein